MTWLIGELRDGFADATIIVASDHGFGAQVRTFYVNSWLERMGLLAWQEGQAPESRDAAALGLNQLARHVYQIDWSRTRAFAPMPSGNGIHIVKADEAHPHGVTSGEYPWVSGTAGRPAARREGPGDRRTGRRAGQHA